MHRKSRLAALTVLMFVAGLFGMPALRNARAAGDVTVTASDGTSGIAGAFVTMVPDDGNSADYHAGVTGANGEVTFTAVADKAYTVRASLRGYAVGSTAVTVSGANVSATITLVASGAVLELLPAYGGQVGTVVADGVSGVFYANTTGLPSLYRTSDYGATWVPVTLDVDDADDGATSTAVLSSPATSGFPGEIAATADGRVYWSRDFGTTWDQFNLPSGSPAQGSSIQWARVGSTSILIYVASTTSRDMAWAAMPTTTGAPAPSFTTLNGASSFKSNNADRLSLARGSDAPILAVGSSSQIQLYELDGSAMTPATAAGHSTSINPGVALTLLRLGGPSASGPTVGGGTAPDTLLYYDGTDGRIAEYSGGSWNATTTYSFRNGGDDLVNGGVANLAGANCGLNGAGEVGSVAPSGGAGTLASCWVERDAGTGALIVRPVQGINNNTGYAYDAGYDGTTNAVALSGDGSKGVVKSASFSIGRPAFGSWPAVAGAGTGSATSGMAVNGIQSPVVRDTAFGTTSGDMIVAFSFTGGGRVVFSADGGTTFEDLPQRLTPGGADEQKGANAVDWWAGATSGSYWVLIGRPDDGLRLGALTQASDAALTSTDRLVMLPGTDGTFFGASEYPIAIRGIDGTDRALVGSSSQVSNAGQLLLVTLSNLTTTPTKSIVLNHSTTAIDYCPTTGSAASVANVAFAAENTSSSAGQVWRINTPDATPSPSAATGISVYVNEVRAGCTDAVVYAGTNVSSGAGLWRSTDGGATFTQLTITASGLANANNLQRIETLAVDPADNNRVMIATPEGDVLETSDGGSSWTVVNDSADRGFGAERPGDLEYAPARATRSGMRSTSRAGVAASEPLFGSASGLFTVEGVTTSTTIYVPIIRR
jgi:hypothetical protein